MTVRGIKLTNKPSTKSIFISIEVFQGKVIMDECVAQTSIMTDIGGKNVTINVAEDIVTILTKLKQEEEQYKKENFLL
jgi:hypothetical protein